MKKAGWLPKVLVGFSVLLVLGVGGYFGQVWLARKLASDYYAWCHSPGFDGHMVIEQEETLEHRLAITNNWRHVPFYGSWGEWAFNGCSFWIPRRAWYESNVKIYGVTLPNDPDAWEAWFKTHPNLVWDEKQNRLVEGRGP